MRLTAALLALATALTAAPALGAMEPCDGATLPALIAKNVGKTAMVPPGVYCGDVFLPMGTSLVSTDGAERTVIVGGMYGILLDHGEHMNVKGFTIRDAMMDGIRQDDSHHGGAIILADNVFRGNGGWGVNLMTMHDAFVERSLFLGNGLGGALLAGEMMMGMSYHVIDSVFRNEPVAAAYVEGMNARFRGNVVSGGGVGVLVEGWETLYIYENMFEHLEMGLDLNAMCTMPVRAIGVTYNHFRDNGVGILSRGGSEGCAEPFGVQVLRAEHNRFTGHAAYAIDHMASLPKGPASAPFNYWGSDVGPNPLMTPVPGLGDMVSLGVDFRLWCTSVACPPNGA